jgi:hypothetical protein
VIPTATEAWPAIFGGLIPIVGLVAVGYLIWRTVRDDDNDPESGENPRK